MLAEKTRDDIASLIVKLGSCAISLRGESLSATSFLFRSVPHPGQHHGREYVSGTEGISEGAPALREARRKMKRGRRTLLEAQDYARVPLFTSSPQRGESSGFGDRCDDGAAFTKGEISDRSPGQGGESDCCQGRRSAARPLDRRRCCVAAVRSRACRALRHR